MKSTRIMLGIGPAIAALMGGSMINVIPALPTDSNHRGRRGSRASRPVRPSRSKRTTLFEPNGKREIARRLRQIAAGQLTRANGLVTAEELYGRSAA